MSWKNVPINHKLWGPGAFLYAAIQSISSLPPVHLGAWQASHVLWHHINIGRAGGPIKRSIKLTLSPAACFSACAARWGRRAAGSGTRSRPWWGTPSRRCSRNPAPGGPLHLGRGGGGTSVVIAKQTTRRFLIPFALIKAVKVHSRARRRCGWHVFLFRFSSSKTEWFFFPPLFSKRLKIKIKFHLSCV